MPRGEPVVALNVNTYLDSWARSDGGRLDRGTFLSIYSQGVDKFTEAHDVSLLFVSTQHQDEGLTRELMQMCKSTSKHMISNKDYNHVDIKGVLGSVSLLFAMRLHAIILASSMHTPVCGLAYQPKVRHYLKTVGIEDRCMEFDDFTL